MYPLQSAKCHELDQNQKVGSAEGPRAVRATHAVYSSAVEALSSRRGMGTGYTWYRRVGVLDLESGGR